MSFNKGKLTLLEDLYESDIIIASPLGLAMETSAIPWRDFDFLSSIEILILDKSEVFTYQNLEHLEVAMQNVNVYPQRTDKLGDIQRIEQRFLDKQASKYRQTISITKFRTLD